MRFAFLTDELPRPGEAGHLALNFAILSWLWTQGHEVVVLLVGSRLAAPVERVAFSVAGPQVRQTAGFVWPGGFRALLKILARATLRALPAGLARRLQGMRHQADAVLGAFLSPEEEQWAARWVAHHRPDAVLVDTVFRAGVLGQAELAGLNSVVVAHDVFYLRHQALEAAGYRVRPKRLTRAQEAGLLRGARHIAAIQPDEARILKAMCPGQNVFSAPMPATPCPPPVFMQRIPGRLVFIGSASLPNLDGLRWFFAAVWPALAGRGITLDLVGDCGAAVTGLPPGVARLGRVRDMAPVLHRAALAIAPLRTGSGLKIKLLDYMRHGLFTVATPDALEGFMRDAAAPFYLAGDALDFAQTILRHALAPPPPQVALDYAGRHYGMAASFSGLAAALRLPAMT